MVCGRRHGVAGWGCGVADGRCSIAARWAAVWTGTATVSHAFHARFTRHQRHGARCPRLDQRATMRQHLTVVTPSRRQMRPALSHAIPQRHGLTTPQKPHDSNGSVSNSEMLSWELHATFVELHPLWSIKSDQQQATARIHVMGSSAPANRSGATHHFTDPWPLTRSTPRHSAH